MIPGVFVPVIEFDVPTRAEDLTKRLHNKFVKDALRETLEEYHRKFVRKKFQLGNSARYGYESRSKRYNRRKQRVKGHQIPMLWSGESRSKMAGAPPKIRIGGSAEGGKSKPKASATYRFPFKGGSGKSDARNARGNNVVKQLVKEFSRWADEEIKWAAAEFHKRYWDKVNSYRSRRKRIRMPKS